MINYHSVVVTGHSQEQLSANIRHHVAQGYVCDGNSTVANLSTGKMQYAQEMVIAKQPPLAPAKNISYRHAF